MSSSVSKPIIKQIKDRQDALDFFEHVSLPKNMISNTQITALPEYDIQFWNAMRNKETREDILAKGRILVQELTVCRLLQPERL